MPCTPERSRRDRLRWKVRLLDGRDRCERCGFSDVRALTFHHPDPTRKETSLGRIGKWRPELLDEARACDVLCANCHSIEHTNWEGLIPGLSMDLTQHERKLA